MPKVGMEPIRRKQVINATLSCIVDEGLDKVTLDKAAERAGVSKGVVAYYFKNKHNLLIESFRKFLEDYMLSVEVYLNESGEDNNSARDLLKAIGAISIGALVIDSGNDSLSPEDAGKVILQMYSRIAIDENYKALTCEMYKGYQMAMDETVRYGIQNGEWMIQDVPTTVLQMMAMLEGLIIFAITDFAGNRTKMYECFAKFVDSL